MHREQAGLALDHNVAGVGRSLGDQSNPGMFPSCQRRGTADKGADSLSRRSGLAKAAADKQKSCQPISLGNKLIRSSPKLPIPVKLFKLTRRHLRLER